MKKIILGPSIILLCISFSFSQTSITNFQWQPENKINFYTYPALPHKVQGFAQDKYGYLWIGSMDGLYRFDGVSYKRFAHDDNDSNSIGANDCVTYLVDSRGMLWVRTSTGLSMFNTATYKCRNYSFSDSLFSDVITGVAVDHQNNIWLSSFGRKNLTKYEPAQDKFTAYSIPDSLYGKGIRTFGLTLNQDGKIYLGADAHVLVFNTESEKYEKSIPHLYPGHGDTLLYWGALCILSDKAGTIYTGDWANPFGKLSIGIYDRKRQLIVNTYADVDAKDYATFRIAEKTDDELWIGTSMGGLFIYNKKTMQCTPCVHKADDSFSFPEEPVSDTYHIFKDRTGCFWFNSNNKIVKADLLDQTMKSYDLKKLFDVSDIPGFNVTSVMELPEENKLMIGTWDGAGFYEVDLKKK